MDKQIGMTQAMYPNTYIVCQGYNQIKQMPSICAISDTVCILSYELNNKSPFAQYSNLLNPCPAE